MTVDRLYRDAVTVRDGLLADNPDMENEDAVCDAARDTVYAMSVIETLGLFLHDQFLLYRQSNFVGSNLLETMKLTLIEYLEERLDDA